MKKTIIISLFLVLFLPFVSGAYDVVELKNGGSIEGTVMFAGSTIPKDETIKISSDVKYCGNSLPAEKYFITPERMVKNGVVYIVGIKGGKATPKIDATVENTKCAFVPHVGVGFVGNNFTTKNEDPMFHNIHTYIGGKTVYNIGLPNQGAVVSKPLRKAGLMEITCDAHPWMHAYVYVFDHPYAAVSNEKGAFEMKEIPPGVYNIEAWHEALGTAKMGNVKVEAGKASKIKLEFK